jgi:hypothetical protein
MLFSRSLSPADVACLEPLRSLQQVELHGFTFVQRAIAVFLNRGEMYKNIFSGGSLDKAIALSPVKPLYCSLLSHKVLLSFWSFELKSRFSVKPRRRALPQGIGKPQPFGVVDKQAILLLNRQRPLSYAPSEKSHAAKLRGLLVSREFRLQDLTSGHNL